MPREGYVEFTLRLPIELHRRIKHEMKVEGASELTSFIRAALQSYAVRKRAERAVESDKR